MIYDENYQKVVENTLILEKFTHDMTAEVESIRQTQLQEIKKELADEIVRLRAEVQNRLEFLKYLQKSNNKLIISIPKSNESTAIDLIVERYTQQKNIIDFCRSSGSVRHEEKTDSKDAKEKSIIVNIKKKKEQKKKHYNAEDDSLAVDPIFLLDIRVGQVLHAKLLAEEPDFFVIKINCGEQHPVSIVAKIDNSNAVQFVENLMVVVVCNMPPINFCGTISEGRILCTWYGNSVGLFQPPKGCIPGDVVQCIHHIRVPIPQPKTTEKVLDQFSSQLSIHKNNIVCYKGCALYVGGKGHISTQEPLTIFKNAGMNVAEGSEMLENK